MFSLEMSLNAVSRNRWIVAYPTIEIELILIVVEWNRRSGSWNTAIIFSIKKKIVKIYMHEMHRRTLKPSEAIVHFVDWFLIRQQQSKLFFYFSWEFFFWELHVKCNIKHAEKIAVLVIWHSFSLLTNTSTWPSHFVTNDMNFVAIQVFNI